MLNKYKPIGALITVYFLAYFLLLLNRGVYWDGWLWFSLLNTGKFSILWSMIVEQLKIPATYYIFQFLFFSGQIVLTAKIIIFLSWLVAGISLFNILKIKFTVREEDAFFISTIFFLIPNFLVRLELTITVYSVCTALFFLAAWLYFIGEKKSKKYKIALYSTSYLLFLASFFMNSFLVFYGGFLLILLVSYLKLQSNRRIIRSIFLWFRRYCVMILAPIIFWLIKSSFGKPSGVYANTYSFTPFQQSPWHFLLYSIDCFWNNIVYGLFWPLVYSFNVLERKIFFVIFAIIFSIIYIIIRKTFVPSPNQPESDGTKSNLYLFISGLVFFIIGLIPYFAVNKMPHPYGYGFGMRHALLLPLGSSLLIFSLINIFFKEKFKLTLKVLMVSLLITANIFFYFTADMDWYKQLAIINKLGANPELTNNASIIIFNDQLKDFNWNNRGISTLEYIAYLYQATHKTDKFGIEYDYVLYKPAWKEILLTYLEHKDYYFLNDYRDYPTMRQLDIYTDSQYKTPTAANWLKIKYFEIFANTENFHKKIDEVFQLKITPKTFEPI
ncbi:MAG: hypothetical protein WCX71_02000 [Candidatus Buchananbacteria bacterium]